MRKYSATCPCGKTWTYSAFGYRTWLLVATWYHVLVSCPYEWADTVSLKIDEPK